MKTLSVLVKRNAKIYFQDKGLFLTSLITPLILLVLYGTFLRKVYEDSFRQVLTAAGIQISDKILAGCVGGQLFSSMLAVSCVTVAFCSNLVMVQDKVTGARRDLTISPVKASTLALGYYFATLLSTLIVCLTALGVCFVYLAITGWCLRLVDVAAVLLDVILLVLFGTALSSCILFPMSTQGQASGVGTIVSSGYGFICGAYMPISSFSKGLQNVVALLPGTYGTALMRNHAMNGPFAAMEAEGVPTAVIDAIRDSVDCNIYAFETKVAVPGMYAILLGTIVFLVLLYILLNRLHRK